MSSVCPKCGAESLNPNECTVCGVIFRKFLAPPHASEQSKNVVPEESMESYGAKLWMPDSFWLRISSIPFALIFAGLARKVPVISTILEAFRIWFHEFGHAVIAWCSSRAATPLGVGWTNINPEKSWVVFICFGFLLGVMVWKGWEHRSYFLIGLGAILFCLQIYFTFLASYPKYQISMSYAGIGAEFYFGTLAGIAFFYRFPERVRWDFFRWIFLIAGAYSFMDAYLQWMDIAERKASIPWGTLLHGESDAGGDMNRLYDEWGWTKQEIIAVYLRTGFFCALAWVGQYLAIALWAIKERKSSA